jgi:hypothetical protein
MPKQVMGKLGVLWKARQQEECDSAPEGSAADSLTMGRAGEEGCGEIEEIEAGMSSLYVGAGVVGGSVSVAGGGGIGGIDDPFAFDD